MIYFLLIIQLILLIIGMKEHILKYLKIMWFFTFILFFLSTIISTHNDRQFTILFLIFLGFPLSTLGILIGVLLGYFTENIYLILIMTSIFIFIFSYYQWFILIPKIKNKFKKIRNYDKNNNKKKRK